MPFLNNKFVDLYVWGWGYDFELKYVVVEEGLWGVGFYVLHP